LCFGIGLARSERLGDEIPRLIELTRIHRQDPQQVQRFGVGGIGFQRLAVIALRALTIPRQMGLQALINQMVRMLVAVHHSPVSEYAGRQRHFGVARGVYKLQKSAFCREREFYFNSLFINEVRPMLT